MLVKSSRKTFVGQAWASPTLAYSISSFVCTSVRPSVCPYGLSHTAYRLRIQCNVRKCFILHAYRYIVTPRGLYCSPYHYLVSRSQTLTAVMIPQTVRQWVSECPHGLDCSEKGRGGLLSLPMPGRSGFSDADRGELLRLQAADKPHCGRKGSGLELGELDLQVADKPHCGRLTSLTLATQWSAFT